MAYEDLKARPRNSNPETHEAGITFVTDFTLQTPVECNATHLNQVWMNLLQNAVDAFDKNSVTKEIAIRTWREEQMVFVSIADNGHGIPAEHLDNIFDLYFTTKSINKGTGMGLHMVRKIILDHHGDIGVESELQKGTTFIVSLPTQQQK